MSIIDLVIYENEMSFYEMFAMAKEIPKTWVIFSLSCLILLSSSPTVDISPGLPDPLDPLEH